MAHIDCRHQLHPPKGTRAKLTVMKSVDMKLQGKCGWVNAIHNLMLVIPHFHERMVHDKSPNLQNFKGYAWC